jgi:hypothetical protein
MFDVIEHLDQPGAALAQVKRYLAPGGKLFITTPDNGSLVARVLGSHWHHYDLTQHIAMFNFTNLAGLLSAHGFHVRSWRRVGHVYRLSYIEQRIGYLARSSRMWALAHPLVMPLRLWPDRRISLSIGDVIGVVAGGQA